MKIHRKVQGKIHNTYRTYLPAFTLGCLLLLLYLNASILIPFIVAAIIAYLLQPVIYTICKCFKLSRQTAVIYIFILFISSWILILIIVIPIIYQQLITFINNTATYKEYINQFIDEFLVKSKTAQPIIEERITDFTKKFLDESFSVIGLVTNHLWDYTLATINICVIIALVPVILYYLLRDWPGLAYNISLLLPADKKQSINQLWQEINNLLSAYVRGQLNICLILSSYYVIGFSVIRVDLALLMGIMAGFLIVIPVIGTALAFFMTLLNCYFNFGLSWEVMGVIILFIVGYLTESFFLTPRIIGDKIGLHPVWILLAVLAGGNMFGFIGILFAIPAAGVIKILGKHLIIYYQTNLAKE